jgi:hypothetical protein
MKEKGAFRVVAGLLTEPRSRPKGSRLGFLRAGYRQQSSTVDAFSD